MVREIVKDTEFLSQKCIKVEKGEDISEIIQDLKDTAEAHREAGCLGLAANQIGYSKRVIIVLMDNVWKIFINPVVMGSKRYAKIDSKESCLSLEGERVVKRYRYITLVYDDVRGIKYKVDFARPDSIVLQHETDHTNGILI